MSTVAATDAWLLEGHHAEWQFLSERRCNVLLEGTVAATDAALRLLQPRIREPLVCHRPPATLQLPTGAARTLILREAAALHRDEQRTLLAWMNDADSTQIVTTSSCTLFGRVETGLFDAALYYRLNIVLLCIPATFQGGMRCDGVEDAPVQPGRDLDIAACVTPHFYDVDRALTDPNLARRATQR